MEENCDGGSETDVDLETAVDIEQPVVKTGQAGTYQSIESVQLDANKERAPILVSQELPIKGEKIRNMSKEIPVESSEKFVGGVGDCLDIYDMVINSLYSTAQPAVVAKSSEQPGMKETAAETSSPCPLEANRVARMMQIVWTEVEQLTPRTQTRG